MLAEIRRQLDADATGAVPTLPPVMRGTAGTENPLARFRAALESVGGQCVVVADETAAAMAVQEILAQIGAQRVALSDAALVQRIAAKVQTDAELRADYTPSDLFDCDAGVTSAQWGVAETGTLVLAAAHERHRLASLVPPVHIALLEAKQLRHTLGEIFAELDAHALGHLVTFVTGPSRTSDIELTLAIGVHGPAALHVIIIARVPEN